MMGIYSRQLFAFLGLAVFIFLAIGSTEREKYSSMTKEQKWKHDLQVIDTGWEKDGYSLYVVGAVVNCSDKHYRYVQVAINLYDKSNAQVGSTMANVTNLEPRGKWKFRALVRERSANRFEVVDVSGS